MSYRSLCTVFHPNARPSAKRNVLALTRTDSPGPCNAKVSARPEAVRATTSTRSTISGVRSSDRRSASTICRGLASHRHFAAAQYGSS